MRQIFPIRRRKLARAERAAVDSRLTGENTAHKLILCHFEAEKRNRNLLPLRHIRCDVQRKRGFAHAGARRKDQKIRAAQSGEQRIQIGIPRGNAQISLPVGAGDLLQMGIGIHDHTVDRRQRRCIAPGTDLVNFLLGAFQKKIGIGFFPGLLQNVFGRVHQLAHAVFFYNDPDVIFRMRQRGNGFGKLCQIHLGRVFRLEDIGGLHRCQQRDKIHRRSAGEQAHDLGKDLAVLPHIKHLRAQRFHKLCHDLRIQKRRAEHRLLRNGAVRQIHTERFERQAQTAGAAMILRGHGPPSPLCGLHPISGRFCGRLPALPEGFFRAAAFAAIPLPERSASLLPSDRPLPQFHTSQNS